MKNMYLTAVLGLLILTGCSNNSDYEGPDTPGNKAEIWATISEPLSRVNGTTWAVGDCIGVSVTNGDKGSTNVQYQYSGDMNQPFIATGERNDIYIKGNGTVELTAYHPYTGNSGIMTNLSLTTSSEMQEPAKQSAIDCMFAQATTTRENPKINFQFTHQMSLLNLDFKYSDGSLPGKVSYTLKGIIIKGSFDTTTGIAVPNEEAGKENINREVASSMISSLILFPQTMEEIEVEVVADGILYQQKIENMELEATTIHSYTATMEVDGSGITISKNGVADWKPGTGGEINSTPDHPSTDTSAGVSNWGSTGNSQDIKSESAEE